MPGPKITPMDNADRISKLDQDPRIHLADWIIAVTEIAGSYGTNYHPINGWIDVGILTTEIQWRSSLCPPGSYTRL